MPQNNDYIVENNPRYYYTEEQLERFYAQLEEWHLEFCIKDNEVKSKKKEIKQYPIVKFLEGLK